MNLKTIDQVVTPQVVTTTAMAKRIEVWPIDRLVPYSKNARTHSDEQVMQIAASIAQFGFTNPLLVDSEAGILAGHGRLLAAQKLGLTEVPVIVLDHLSEIQKRAYIIADNKLAMNAGWNEEVLSAELAQLEREGFDLELIGFSDREMEELLRDEHAGDVDPDAVPEPPDEAITKPGDLWVLGNHRLLCGDSSRAEDVDRLLAGESIHMVNTDPPYNVKVEPRSNNAIAAGNSSFGGLTHHQSFDVHRGATNPHKTTSKMRPKDRQLANDFMSDELFSILLRKWFGNLSRVLIPGRGFYIWGGYANVANYPPALKESALYFSQTIIWVKEHPVLTRKDFMGNHEWCFYGWKEGAAHYFHPEIHNATDVWEVKKVNPQSMIHLTEKPVELAVRAMTYSSKPKENVLDLFGGSGSTLIAAEQTERNAFLMEIDPPYCDVIVKRWEEFTGDKAILSK